MIVVVTVVVVVMVVVLVVVVLVVVIIAWQQLAPQVFAVSHATHDGAICCVAGYISSILGYKRLVDANE